MPLSPSPSGTEDDQDADRTACVLVFNANDPSGAGGLSSDVSAMTSVGVHALTVVTGAYARDTTEIVDHHVDRKSVV